MPLTRPDSFSTIPLKILISFKAPNSSSPPMVFLCYQTLLFSCQTAHGSIDSLLDASLLLFSSGRDGLGWFASWHSQDKLQWYVHFSINGNRKTNYSNYDHCAAHSMNSLVLSRRVPPVTWYMGGRGSWHVHHSVNTEWSLHYSICGSHLEHQLISIHPCFISRY